MHRDERGQALGVRDDRLRHGPRVDEAVIGVDQHPLALRGVAPAGHGDHVAQVGLRRGRVGRGAGSEHLQSRVAQAVSAGQAYLRRRVCRSDRTARSAAAKSGQGGAPPGQLRRSCVDATGGGPLLGFAASCMVLAIPAGREDPRNQRVRTRDSVQAGPLARVGRAGVPHLAGPRFRRGVAGGRQDRGRGCRRADQQKEAHGVLPGGRDRVLPEGSRGGDRGDRRAGAWFRLCALPRSLRARSRDAGAVSRGVLAGCAARAGAARLAGTPRGPGARREPPPGARRQCRVHVGVG